MKIHLEFEELAFHEAQDEARLARAHVSKQNLRIRREYSKGKKNGEILKGKSDGKEGNHIESDERWVGV